jgi:hypothetical protein
MGPDKRGIVSTSTPTSQGLTTPVGVTSIARASPYAGGCTALLLYTTLLASTLSKALTALEQIRSSCLVWEDWMPKRAYRPMLARCSSQHASFPSGLKAGGE